MGDSQLGEEEVLPLLGDFNDSQFEFETSTYFMLNRTREINAVQSLMDGFPEESNIAIADYIMANDVEFIFKKKMVVVLDFSIFKPKSLIQGFLDGSPVDESDCWFNNDARGEYFSEFPIFSTGKSLHFLDGLGKSFPFVTS